MLLWGVHLSPFVRKVAVALTVKGVEFDQKIIVPGSDDPDFIALSPLRKIPVLQDGEVVIPDSSVICEYLEEKFPHPPMLPSGAEARAQARFLEEFGDSRLVEYTAIPFIENFAGPKLFGRETDAERVREAEEELIPSVLDYVEARVPSEGFLFGDFCTADIALVSPMFNARYGDYTVDATRWPRFAAFVERVEQYGPVAQVRATEAEVFAQLTGG